MIENLLLSAFVALMAKPVPSHADSVPVVCGGRCVMIEQGETARQKLQSAPRPGFTMIYVDELGTVDGNNLTKMGEECTARAAAHAGANADSRGVLVDFISLYPFGDLKAVVDIQTKQACTARF